MFWYSVFHLYPELLLGGLWGQHLWWVCAFCFNSHHVLSQPAIFQWWEKWFPSVQSWVWKKSGRYQRVGKTWRILLLLLPHLCVSFTCLTGSCLPQLVKAPLICFFLNNSASFDMKNYPFISYEAGKREGTIPQYLLAYQTSPTSILPI